MDKDTKALTVRLSPETARQLQIYKALTGESINTLATRLLEDYLQGEGRAAMTEAGFARVERDYGAVLAKLAE